MPAVSRLQQLHLIKGQAWHSLFLAVYGDSHRREEVTAQGIPCTWIPRQQPPPGSQNSLPSATLFAQCAPTICVAVDNTWLRTALATSATDASVHPQHVGGRARWVKTPVDGCASPDRHFFVEFTKWLSATVAAMPDIAPLHMSLPHSPAHAASRCHSITECYAITYQLPLYGLINCVRWSPYLAPATAVPRRHKML